MAQIIQEESTWYRMKVTIISTNELTKVWSYINRVFGEETAQEVAVRLLERCLRSDLLPVGDWMRFGVTTARRFKWREKRKLDFLTVLDADMKHTLMDSVERQLIAREDLRRLVKCKHGERVIKYALYRECNVSRERIKQHRQKLRAELVLADTEET